MDLRHQVLRVGRPRQTAVFPGDELARHWVGLLEGRIVAVLSVFRADFPDGPGPALQLRGMAVAPGLQGQGRGGVLLEGVQSELGCALWCNARERAVSFYERHGWRVVSEPFDIPGVGAHRRMVYQETVTG